MYITIKPAKFSDVDTMCEWGAAHQELWGDKHGWYTKKSIRLMITDPREHVTLVARDGEILVGMCIGYNLRDWAMIDTLFVVEAYQGKGVGKLLLETAIDMLSQQGCEQFALLVNRTNHQAEGFYEKLGFEKSFEFVWMQKGMKHE